jgi:CIC family chloride channel protein
MAIVYIRSFYCAVGLFKKSRLPNWLRPVVGAVITGLIALALYWYTNRDARALAVLGTGYGGLQIALTEPASMGAALLLALAAAKILATSATIGSGGSGGVFGPSMVIGGATGAAVGLTFKQLAPQIVTDPAGYTLIGMAGFFAAAGRAPISTIVMVTELTGDFGLLVPAMWVSMLSFTLCQRWTIYHEQVLTRLDSPAHRGEFLADVLEGITVADVPWTQRQTVFEGMPLNEIVEMFAASSQHYFPVVDAAGHMVGIFSSDDVRGHLYNQEIWQLANARDVMTQHVISVTPGDDLNTALRRFTERNLDELPVVRAEDSSQLLGMLRRKDVIACYNRTLKDRKSDD